MPEPKTTCKQCGVEILVATATRTGGTCMPCHQQANRPIFEITEEDEERHRKIDVIVKQLLAGCSEEEFARLSCPRCGSALALHVHPKLRAFAVTCTVSTLHVMRHESVSEAPAWWRSKITGDWLDDVRPRRLSFK